MALLAAIALVLWLSCGAIALAEGLGPRGSIPFRIVNVLAEVALCAVAVAVIWEGWIR